MRGIQRRCFGQDRVAGEWRVQLSWSRSSSYVGLERNDCHNGLGVLVGIPRNDFARRRERNCF